MYLVSFEETLVLFLKLILFIFSNNFYIFVYVYMSSLSSVTICVHLFIWIYLQLCVHIFIRVFITGVLCFSLLLFHFYNRVSLQGWIKLILNLEFLKSLITIDLFFISLFLADLKSPETCLLIISPPPLCSPQQPPGACEGGAHWGGGGQSTRVLAGRRHAQPAVAERRAWPRGGSPHWRAGVGQIRDRPEGRILSTSDPLTCVKTES